MRGGMIFTGQAKEYCSNAEHASPDQMWPCAKCGMDRFAFEVCCPEHGKFLPCSVCGMTDIGLMLRPHKAYIEAAEQKRMQEREETFNLPKYTILDGLMDACDFINQLRRKQKIGGKGFRLLENARNHLVRLRNAETRRLGLRYPHIRPEGKEGQ